MNKLNKLFAILIAVLGVGSLSAQTDVTSLYLTNADFSQGEPATANIFGYGKDGTPYGLQTIAGWSTYVISGDDSNKSYPNSGMAGAMLAYGSSPQLKGNNKSAPAADPTGNTYGNCLGFMAVWGCGGYYYQEVELLAGDYSLSVDIYNQSGTQNNTSYIGFFVNEGPSYTIPVNPAVGKWVKNSVTFSLAAKTKGKIAIGYKSNGNGSGVNPHIFIDNVILLHSKLEEPNLPRLAEVNGNEVNLDDFNVGAEDYTLVVKGTIGKEINITAESVSYTPLSNNIVRFVKYNNVMHVYEGSDYMGPIASKKASYTYKSALTTEDPISNNLLQNPSFETVGGKISDNKYKFGTPWETNVTATNIRIDKGNKAKHGSHVLVWRGSGNNDYFSQQLTNLKPFKGYKAYLLQVDRGNANAYFNIGIGSKPGDYSLCAKTIKLGTNVDNKIHELELGNIANISEGYFTFRNTTNNTASAGSDPVTQIDWIGLVASDNFILSGAQSATILYGGAYAPISLDKDKADWETAKNTANEVLSSDDYKNIIGSERSKVEEKLNITPEESVEAYTSAREALYEAIEDLKNAKADYDVLDAEKNIALGLGMSEETIASIVTTDKTGLEALQDLKVAEYNYIQSTYTKNATLGKWEEDFGGDLDGEGYKAGGPKYLDDWQSNKTTRTTKQTVTLPAGDYALSVIARGQVGASGNLYYKIGDVTTEAALIMKGNRGRGVDVNGVANFSDEGEYNCNGEGFGWEYRFITFHLDTETQVEIGASVTIQGQWASVYAPVLLTTEASVKALRMTEIANLLSTVPAGKMNATVQSTLNEKKGAAEAASVEGNTIDELETITTELNEAINAAKTSIAEYEKIAGYIAKANTIDESIAADVQTRYDNGTLDKAEPVFQALEVATYNYVTANFNYAVPISSEWNSTGTNTSAKEFNNEHWSGEARGYMNQNDDNGQGWNANAWSLDFDQDVTLPAGEYVFKVAGRKSANATLQLVVTMGETTLGTVSDFPNGNASLGITKTGEASFDPEDPAGFANNGAGFGWQWRYVKFTLDAEATTVKIAVHAETNAAHNWVSFGDYTLQMTEETYLEANKGALDAPTAAAEALVDSKPMGTAEKDALTDALALPVTTGAELLAKIDALNAAVANANTWVAEYNEAKAPLVAALERFETDYNDAENGALDYMCKSRWAKAVNMAQAAAVAKDVTDSYEGFATATENLVAALDAATVSVGEYAALKTAIDEATLYLNGNDWGSDPFQKPESAKDDFNTIKTTAQNAYDAAEVDGEGVTAVIESLSTAVNDVVLNAPVEGQRFYIKVATEGHANAGNAILATLGNTDANNPTGYRLNTDNEAKGYLAQAFIFTQVEGNLYNISIERPESTVYLTYGSLNGSAAGWKNQQIQATTDAEKKGEFKIVPTGQNGILKIFNTVDNNYIDCQAGGAIYTDTGISNEEFAFELAPEHEVALSISSAGWATLILPFNAEIPEGVRAFSCFGSDEDNVLALTEATGTFAANTPYLVSGTGKHAFSGYGLAQQDTCIVGLFTGTYVDYQTTANSNTYVLQKHDDEVAFYLVGESAHPVVKPYRIYMTYEAPAGETAAPMFRIGRGTTGIEDAEWTMDNGQWTIYDLMGRKVTTMEKGNMYIVNGKKVVIK